MKTQTANPKVIYVQDDDGVNIVTKLGDGSFLHTSTQFNEWNATIYQDLKDVIAAIGEEEFFENCSGESYVEAFPSFFKIYKDEDLIAPIVLDEFLDVVNEWLQSDDYSALRTIALHEDGVEPEQVKASQVYSMEIYAEDGYIDFDIVPVGNRWCDFIRIKFEYILSSPAAGVFNGIIERMGQLQENMIEISSIYTTFSLDEQMDIKYITPWSDDRMLVHKFFNDDKQL